MKRAREGVNVLSVGASSRSSSLRTRRIRRLNYDWGFGVYVRDVVVVVVVVDFFESFKLSCAN
jgi:hypothetical protein